MHHSIIGLSKLKRGDVVGRASHHLREHQVPNADPSRASLNVTSWASGARGLADAIESRVGPLRKRKDAVSAIELLLTATPEWFVEHGGRGKTKDLVQCARKWLAATFGARNIAAMGVHLDERTPHVWAIVTPITADGRLSASDFCGSPKKMEALHDSWASSTKHLGLERGVRGSKAKHIDIRKFYAAVNGSAIAAHQIAREMNARARRAKERSEEAEAEWERGSAHRKKVSETLQAERVRLQQLAASMTPDEQYAASKKLDSIKRAVEVKKEPDDDYKDSKHRHRAP